MCDRVHYICAEKKNKSQQSTHNFSLISANSISVWKMANIFVINYYPLTNALEQLVGFLCYTHDTISNFHRNSPASESRSDFCYG